jgi:hypothetical protein
MAGEVVEVGTRDEQENPVRDLILVERSIYIHPLPTLRLRRSFGDSVRSKASGENLPELDDRTTA